MAKGGRVQHLEVFLARRDGVDKTLKIIRYASRLWLAIAGDGQKSDLSRRLEQFEGKVNLSRKALRLGKFVQNVNALGLISESCGSSLHLRALYLLAHAGEGTYYFLEQVLWLMKSGLISTKHAKRISMISACAELAGYAGSLPLKILQLRVLRAGSAKTGDRRKLIIKTFSIVQDLLDGTLALSSVTDGPRKILSTPAMLAMAGLLSGVISAQKVWSSC